MLQEIDGEGGEQVIASLEDISKDLGNMIVEFAFGDIYTRNGLDLQEREMLTLASLLTQGACVTQLRVHIQGAVPVGITCEGNLP